MQKIHKKIFFFKYELLLELFTQDPDMKLYCIRTGIEKNMSIRICIRSKNLKGIHDTAKNKD